MVPSVFAAKVEVGFSYLSGSRTSGYILATTPIDALIHRLADALEADEEELLMLAERLPDRIRKRVLQRPDVFGALANCDDRTLDKVMRTMAVMLRGRKELRADFKKVRVNQ